MRKIIIFLLTIISAVGISGCKKQPDYFKYVSECRYDCLYGAEKDYSLTVNLSVTETPKLSDGIKNGEAEIITISLLAPDNTVNYTVEFTYEDNNYKGSMNYHSVKNRHELVLPFNRCMPKELTFKISHGDKEIIINTVSVLNGSELSPEKALKKLSLNKAEVFSSFFAEKAEINIRLLENDGKCYYYIGLLKSGDKKIAFLTDATSGDIIAEKNF